MALPFFYIADYSNSQKTITLDEDTSRHVVQVLRMKTGEQLNLTDGKGSLLTCVITDDHKRHCVVTVREVKHKPQSTRRVSVGISLLKNSNRFEWFLEKATELGVTEIIPLVCERTEKEKFRHDRLQGICTSAMLQSQQVWLPVLQEPVSFTNLQFFQYSDHQKFIAHCEESHKASLTDQPINPLTIILIGPEGDFTTAEIELALNKGFVPVALGDTRLRTETAGVAAATLLCLV